MDLKKLVEIAAVVIVTYWLSETTEAGDNAMDVTPAPNNLLKSPRDYSKGKGLFGKHRGIYYWNR